MNLWDRGILKLLGDICDGLCQGFKLLLLPTFAVVSENIVSGTEFIELYLIDEVLNIFSLFQSRDIYYSLVIKYAHTQLFADGVECTR